MKKEINRMKLEIDARSENESFARTAVAAFAAQFNPTLDSINDLKTAVSEAVTNCIVHAYSTVNAPATILIECSLWTDEDQNGISIKVTDFGIGIANIEKALQPFYTTKPEEERSGMGFTVMQSFMDVLKVSNGTDCGTIVEMQKFFKRAKEKKVR